MTTDDRLEPTPLPPNTRMFSGCVASGRGIAGGQVTTHQERLRRLTGVALYPGSLNLILSEPVRLARRRRKRFAHGLYIWPGWLSAPDAATEPHHTYPVWLLRWCDAPLHIIEVLATERLRTRFDLHDGDRLQIHLKRRCLSPVAPEERLLHAAIWGGRRGAWYYSHDDYVASWLVREPGRWVTQNHSLRALLRARWRGSTAPAKTAGRAP
ncbi:hypothetical protein CKO15_07175 [Halorhodospira abdelmalekii]|uniref:DUF120 domain-containing protein n=1 Tax=Halorhodospira abdelmalekii TaxID=421629 RepID=UPI0019056986|nr:DUF120 domain-containing protein [Halorhodospira abdelmalekii]MBK1735069.1 hypothetical protein [Halorhodospira abdelmalekii]